ncbi:MAG: MerR family transcriptional regulator [Angelakisella sp.]
MKINEVAKLTGVTVRTLHYYDEIGLLSPSEVTEAGYRLYDKTALDTLQQILFFRELDFPLAEIKEILHSPTFDRTKALQNHRSLLVQKQQRLKRLIALVEDTIKGDDSMSFKEFDMSEIEKAKQQYAAEAKERWGNSASYAEYEKKTSAYSEADWNGVDTEGNEIMKDFSRQLGEDPASPAVQALVARWQQHISARYYTCTNEILQGLGLMYTCDERFQKNIDQNGEGTAALMSEAIAIYCAKK